jgi:hypothetical protein
MDRRAHVRDRIIRVCGILAGAFTMLGTVGVFLGMVLSYFWMR